MTGQDVTCTFTNTAQPAILTIHKQVQGIDAPWSFEFDGDLDLFYLTNSDPFMAFEGLEAGYYTITETIETGVGVSVSCDSGDAGVNSVTVTLAPAANVVCTFTNSAGPAGLTLIKTVNGPGAGSNWSFDFEGDLGPFTLNKTAPQIAFTNVAPGEYLISETAATGYEASVACDNGDSSPFGDLYVTLDPNEDVTCTFTNTGGPPDFPVLLPVVIR
jgi:hypothetical protein